MPFQRHNDHHSGDTIDRINKATGALHDFSSSQFTYLGTIMYIVGAVIGLMLVWFPSLYFMVAILCIGFIFIHYSDKKIVPFLAERNIAQNKVAARLFDYLSNIRTVITLRFGKESVLSLEKKIDHSYSPFEKSNVKGEMKWFIMNIFLNIGNISMLGTY